jgi:predicted negative regulator of RcsB-dependent stress response
MKDRVVARKKSDPAGDALREMEETGDRVAEWAAQNAALILGAIAAVLVVAAGVGLFIQHGSDARDKAANALALATSQYRMAMGADPGGGAIVEPANPELAERTRTEFAERFSEVAVAHQGTAAGVVAWLEAGNLQVELGRLDDAVASFTAARDEAGDLALAALASTRLAAMAEDRGDPAAAAEEYEAAGGVAAYPMRAEALTSAARCWVEAGEVDRALAAYQRVEAEYPDEPVAPPVEALIAELRLSRQP